jgi:hypothetical protein
MRNVAELIKKPTRSQILPTSDDSGSDAPVLRFLSRCEDEGAFLNGDNREPRPSRVYELPRPVLGDLLGGVTVALQVRQVSH